MITLSSGTLALATERTTGFAAQGGTPPYSFAVLAGGAGGSIGAATGLYTAPPVVSDDPTKFYDTVEVTDSLAATATARILVGTAVHLVCDIIQKEMELAQGQVYLWDQKINIPNDSKLYVAVAIPRVKPYGNTNRPNATGPGVVSEQTGNFMATLDINILSRGPIARDRKEEILLALASNYSLSQQETNSFSIARISSAFINLSEIDGAAIPYRFVISVNINYMVQKAKAVPYMDTFVPTEVTTEP